MSKSKRNFYGNVGDIEMPPLGYQLDDPNAPQKQVEAPIDQPQVNQAFSVPDELPEDVNKEFDQEVDDEIEQDQSEQSESESEPEAPVIAATKAPVRKQEENFKAIREAKERAEKNADRAERERDLLLSKLVEMQAAQPKAVQQEKIEEKEEDFDFNMNDDDLLEGKHAKKLVAELRKMKSEIKSYKTQSYNTSVESKIKNNFPDFDQVVSQENVAVLNEEFPDLAASLRDTSDIYTKAAAAYSVIKKMGIYKEQGAFMKEKEIAITNSKKPRPLASVSPQQGDSPLSKANAFANGLTPELQAQLRREMNDARKGH